MNSTGTYLTVAAVLLISVVVLLTSFVVHYRQEFRSLSLLDWLGWGFICVSAPGFGLLLALWGLHRLRVQRARLEALDPGYRTFTPREKWVLIRELQSFSRI